MTNMQMRNKLRKITAAAKNSEQIPAHTKNIGMRIFFVLASIGVLAIIAFAVTLFIYGHWAGALITLGIALAIAYFVYKIQSAEEIPID